MLFRQNISKQSSFFKCKLKLSVFVLGSFFCTSISFASVELKMIENLSERVDLILPFSVAFLPDGQTMVFDFQTKEIIKLDQNNKEIARFGGAGQGPGEYTGPTHLEVDGDFIYAYDIFERSITRLDLNGKVLDEKKLPEAYSYVKVFDGTNFELFGQGKQTKLIREKLDGKQLQEIKYLEVTDQTNGMALAISQDGTMYSGYFDSYSIDIHDRDGKLIKKVRRTYQALEPIQRDGLDRLIAPPVISGLTLSPEHIIVLLGGMQENYKDKTKKKLGQEYDLHIDVLTKNGDYVGSAWNNNLPKTNDLYGYPLFRIDKKGVLWIAPDFYDGQLYRCQLVVTK